MSETDGAAEIQRLHDEVGCCKGKFEEMVECRPTPCPPEETVQILVIPEGAHVVAPGSGRAMNLSEEYDPHCTCAEFTEEPLDLDPPDRES
jgi:hypothetical protein